MAKIILATLSLTLLTPWSLFSQEVDVQFTTKNTNPGEMLDEMPLKIGDVKGSVYLYDEWRPGKIVFKKSNNEKKVQYVKYDVKSATLDLLIEGVQRTLPIERVKEFKCEDLTKNQQLHFINSQNLTVENLALPTLLEIIEKGKYDLLVNYIWEIKDSNYNAALNVGDRNSRNIITKEFYISVEQKAIKIPKNKNDFMQNMKNIYPDIESLMSTNKLKFKKEEHLIKLVKLMNAG